ncbi:hypothetical protein KUCAC02_025107 [Chaenocephalus aceratus]|nr:hypothetical protein KUCAC02_025107 [Chaenocephalus aceratus]
MAARFLTAREVLGKLYANAAAQDSTDSSSEEGEEEKEKEEHGEDEPRGQGVRGEEDALEYGDEVRVYEDKDHEEDDERVSRGQRAERKEQSGHRETRSPRRRARALAAQRPARGRRVFSSHFAFTPTAALVSYVPKKGRNVVLLSTRHTGPPEISERADEKPRIVLDYNRNKGGVDNLDKVIGAYSCRRMTARWPLVVFHNILDVSCYNAFVVWRELNPGWMPGKRNKRRVFLERLGRALVAPFIERRKRLPRTAASAAVVKAVRAEGARERARCGGGDGGDGDAGTDSARTDSPFSSSSASRPRAQASKRKRCQICPSKKDRKTHAVCCGCGRYVCKSCALAYCPAGCPSRGDP